MYKNFPNRQIVFLTKNLQLLKEVTCPRRSTDQTTFFEILAYFSTEIGITYYYT